MKSSGEKKKNEDCLVVKVINFLEVNFSPVTAEDREPFLETA